MESLLEKELNKLKEISIIEKWVVFPEGEQGFPFYKIIEEVLNECKKHEKSRERKMK